MFQKKLQRKPLKFALVFVIAAIALLIFRDDYLFGYNPTFHENTRLPARPRWQFSSTPAFCKTIVDKPLPYRKCKRDRRTQQCEDGNVTMMSQYSQDYYLYTRHFSKLDRPGIYVDLAANDATYISNTYFMDSCMGWDGICVEANPKYFSDIKKYRSCELVDKCVSDVEGEKVMFIMGDGLGGIEGTNKNSDARLVNHHRRDVEMTCTTMGNVLKDYGVGVIDYLSLDIEGHELKALQGFDWSKVVINVITVEVNKDTVKGITDFLEPKGYLRHRPTLNSKTNASNLLTEDAIFLHQSVTFGDPV